MVRREPHVWVGFLSFLCLIVGCCLIGIGALRPPAYRTVSLTSIPLCRSSPIAASDYIGLPLSAWCSPPASSAYNVTVPIPLSGVLFPDEAQLAYIIHNLWGYAFTVRVCGAPASCQGGFAQSFSHNTNFSDPNATEDPAFALGMSPMETVGRMRTPVACPHATLITQSMGIEPACRNANGYPARIAGKLQYAAVGEVTYSQVSTETVWIVFENMIALPMNYAEEPQVYWASWAKSNGESLIVAGAVVLGFGVLLSVVIYIAF
jgi:hypothetical protein